ncbi:MAG: hypothetical protein HW380_3218 [Magnetococcales bacterium]|nr:hypothetical protein [Magnetococcales bacterium]
MNHNFFPVLLALLTLFMAACGYRFAGDPQQLGRQWANATIRMEGPGTEQNPVLAQKIKDRLRSLMVIPSHTATAPDRTLHIQLEPTQRKRVLEDASGRADQFEMTIEVRLTLEEAGQSRQFPVIIWLAKYYEPKAGASFLSTYP